jgi:hypothetical protein
MGDLANARNLGMAAVFHRRRQLFRRSGVAPHIIGSSAAINPK